MPHYNSRYTTPNNQVNETTETVEEVNETTETVEEVNVVEEQVVKEVDVPSTIIGIIQKCFNLRLRKEPNVNSDTVCMIPVNTKIIVDKNKTTRDFYKVRTVDGKEGYVVKDYVAIK